MTDSDKIDSQASGELRAPAETETIKESKVQPLWHVFILNVFTMSAYSIIWIFKNWKDLADHANLQLQSNDSKSSPLAHFKNISPLLRTIGSLIQYFQLYMMCVFFMRIAQLYPNKNSMVSKHPLVMGIFLVAAGRALLCLDQLPGTFRLLYLLSTIPLMIAQSWLNAYWKTQESSDVLVRQAFSGSELVLLIAGATLIG